MDEVIAVLLAEMKTKEEVPEDVIIYMREITGILIDGLTIDEYMAKYGDRGKLDKGGLQAINKSGFGYFTPTGIPIWRVRGR